MKKIIFVLFLFHFIVSCSSKTAIDGSALSVENRIIENFPEVFQIEGEALNIEVLGIFHAYCVDSLLLAKCRGHKNSYFVYNMNTLQYYGTIFSEGKGPGEYIDLSTSGQYQSNKEGVNLWVYDNSLRRLRNINISQLLEKKENIMNKEFSYSEDYLNFLEIEDDKFLINYYNWKNLYLSIYNAKTKEKVDLFPFFKDNLQNEDVFCISGNSVLKPDKSKIAYAMMYFNQILFSSIDGQDSYSVSIGSPNNRHEISQKSNDRIIYFSMAAATNESLWLLYSGKTKGERLLDNTSSEIFVVDWNGVPLYKLEPKEQLVTIFIDEGKNILYGIDHNEIIYKYNIKDIYVRNI